MKKKWRQSVKQLLILKRERKRGSRMREGRSGQKGVLLKRFIGRTI
jgi:hypothetical protein